MVCSFVVGEALVPRRRNPVTGSPGGEGGRRVEGAEGGCAGSRPPSVTAMRPRAKATHWSAMDALAQFLARHAVGILLSSTLLGVLVVWAFWYVVRTRGAVFWRAALGTWSWWQDTGLARRLARLPVVGTLFVRSLSAFRYLGLHAVVSFVIAAVATTAFVELGEEIGVGESLAEFDVALAAALERHLSSTTLRAFALITRLGDALVLVPLAVGVAVGMGLARRWPLVIMWSVATAGGGLLNVALKQIFARARPPHDHGWIVETSYSFPSGHASGAVVVYGLLAYLIVRYSSSRW